MRALTRAEVASLAESVEALLNAVNRGELTASAAMRHRIEGALAALAVVQGGRADLLTDFWVDLARDPST